MHRKASVFIITLLLLGVLALNANGAPEKVRDFLGYSKPRQNIPDSLQVLRFQVGDIPFSMQRVEGGFFMMGGTSEQHRDPIALDLPVHAVALDAFYIAHTEVTQALWQAVMPEWQVLDWQNPNHPITYVSWNDCQVFIHRLDSITGMPFRLPTEAEWEFAARGGNKSHSYRFAGSNIADTVSWGLTNAGFRKHSVAEKLPNELGLYDMTGNVSEWCQDWYAHYHLATEPNPCGPREGEYKIVRGGSFDNCYDNQHISKRYYYNPQEATNFCGLRLALTLPNEPTLQVEEEPAIVKRVKVKNARIKMRYVPAEEPYYISEQPITQSVWNKVFGQETTDSWSQPVTDKTDSEWNQFLEKCRKQSHAPLEFATEEQVQWAIQQELIDKPQLKTKKKKRWQKDTQSIQKRRRFAGKAQKWADLVGVQIQTAEDPTLQLFNNTTTTSQPRWLVVKK